MTGKDPRVIGPAGHEVESLGPTRRAALAGIGIAALSVLSGLTPGPVSAAMLGSDFLVDEHGMVLTDEHGVPFDDIDG
ncbi:hypothetical protein LB518_16420 [Mesorhizobium sp. BR1-1-16]|uniref:hypothetical protein n=1 Tax=Mesorhizobium sp. BR1-1-16 TaxID=2876653 RepID=UPI001CCA3F92|nr:hypothetical protein [Mesorhizobium sp. BR1-1-16]MBZ9937886.1 hypothetical protein [Mesorhizobium sp. BR1-1-16]